jgi:NAD(P)-dependent dehydrogenase (short-subunit alcohol dehydrogenase family)
VTGGTRGIGQQIVYGLQKLPNIKTIVYTGRSAKAKVAAQYKADGVDKAVFMALDAADAKSIDAFTAAVLKAYGRVDILCNNAGVFLDYAQAGWKTASPANMLATYQVNVVAPYALTQAFLPGMLERKFGRVVQTSSTMGLITPKNPTWPMGDSCAYRQSKTALTMQTAALARSVATTEKNVKLNSFCPGYCDTEMTSTGGDHPSAPRTAKQGADTAVWLATRGIESVSGGFWSDRLQHKEY